jgi:hypothetical protein
MATNVPSPYISRNPGDMITAGDWNTMQVDVKNDIASQIQTAVGNIQSVPHADNADKLGGQTPDQLTQSILKQAEEILPKRTGYLRSFNRLLVGQEKIIKHGLKAMPLCDVYELDYFPAICSDEENQLTPQWVNLFLYHTSERTIKVTLPGTTPGTTVKVTAVIEPSDQIPFRVPFADMLAYYQVEITDTKSLDDLVNDFWKAFWDDPLARFDDDQFGHSPWFKKCCDDSRNVKELKDRGDWDDLWLKMVPRKTINLPATAIQNVTGTVTCATAPRPPEQLDPSAYFDGTPAPTQIQVAHHNFDQIGIKLVSEPTYPSKFLNDTVFAKPANFKCDFKVMVLLKV